jgi:Kef-type K+ transport system membrane component KefB/Trk K+ transport system NAD-binding subunit
MNGVPEGVNVVVAQIGMVLAIAAMCALLARLFRVPLIIGYVGAGLLIGFLLKSTAGLQHLLLSSQHIAFTFLLFLVGLETDWAKARDQLRSGLWVAILQMIGSFGLGLGVAYVFSLSLKAGLFLGLTLTFTSGVVALKLLAERHDLNSLHGRLAASILFIQDIVAIGALSVMEGYTHRSYLTITQESALLIMKGVAVAVLFWLCSRLVVPRLFKAAAKSGELLFLLSLAWCFAGTTIFQLFDLPMEAGALLAGLTLASQPYSFDILSKMRSLRDFFLIFFFINVGAATVLPEKTYIGLTIVLFLGVTIGRPLITFVSLSLAGYRSRTAFLTAVAQSSLSELAVIFALIGAQTLHLSSQLTSAIGITMLASICITALAIDHRQALYHFWQPVLKLTERGHHKHHTMITGSADLDALENHVVIFGYHRMGYHILQELLSSKQPVVVVDFNPEIISKLRASGVTALYGDAEDEQIFHTAQVQKAQMVISTIPHKEETDYLLSTVHSLNPHIPIIVTARTIDDALSYYHQHAAYVLLPHLLSSEHVANLIKNHTPESLEEMSKQRAKELLTLKETQNTLFSD